MASKPEIQSFTQSWNKTVAWAKQNNIPYSAYYPIYQQDSQRLLSSTPMSESERVRAIEAAHGLNYSTALPTDNPDWANLVGNAKRNAADIFTPGLTHLIPNVVDTIKNTFFHPGDIVGAIGDLFTGNLGAAAKDVLKPDNILSWLPGVYDLATVFNADPHLTGTAGGKALATNPITSLLDVIPFGRIASEGLGRTAIGATAADRIGLTVPELRKLGVWRVGGKLVKTAPSGPLGKLAHPWIVDKTDPATGLKTPTAVHSPDTETNLTIGEFWTQFKNKVGAGSEQADIGEETIMGNREGTKAVKAMIKPTLDLIDKEIPKDQYQAFLKWARSETRPLEQVMSDHNIPANMRTAFDAAYQAGQMMKQIYMQGGKVESLPVPWKDADGNTPLDEKGNPLTEDYWVDTEQYRVVKRALDEANNDQASVDKAMEPLNVAMFKMDENDANMSVIFEVMKNDRQSVFDVIKQAIPVSTVTDAALTRLRSTFPTSERWDQAVTSQSPTLRNLLGLPPEISDAERRLFPSLPASVPLTLHMVNSLRDLLAPGGLLDQADRAYEQQDWRGMNKILKTAVRKWNTKSFDNIPKNGQAPLYMLKRMTEHLQKYASERQKVADEVSKRATGYSNGKRLGKAQYQKSVAYLSQKALKSQQQWLYAAVHNPPDVWRNYAMDHLTNNLAQKEKTAASIEKTPKILSFQGWQDSELTHLRQDPKTIQEIMTNEAKASLENQQLPDTDHEESIKVSEDGFNEMASLRARGHAPLYIPELTTRDIDRGEPTYNVYIKGTKARKPGATYSKIWGYTPTIYDVKLGLLQGAKDIVEHDMMEAHINNNLIPRLYDASDIQKTIRNYYSAEINALAEHNVEGGAPTEGYLSILTRGLEQFNLEEFKPDKVGLGEGFVHPGLNAQYYIDKDLARAFKTSTEKFQFPAQSIVDRGTKVFRFSILGLSPRYTAHILFGGTYLVALRSNPSIFKFAPEAVKFALHGSFSDKVLSKLPDADRFYVEHATDEGLASFQYHYVAMNSAGRNWLIPEWLARHSLPDNYSTRLRATADLNMRFTRFIVQAQQAMVYLDGASRSLDKGEPFYADHLVPRQTINPQDPQHLQTDAQGRDVYHRTTGRRIHDTERRAEPMSPLQAHQQGMQAVTRVMGNLKHMTILERSILARIFPFYGWTKHILNYVLSYPFDHPYRAMILSQLALQSQEDWASGLPLRLQLLTFLGSPDQFGNVTAIDTKALNPLRDTANYASYTGLFESLNPAILGVGALIDPQFAFGGQNLYPQVTFNSLYGVNTAGAGGSIATAAEQFVPQLSAIDAAFNISGQYAYLKSSNPTAFSKKIFESLGLPFTPQSLNLRQIAAQGEIDRYKEASAATYQAATTGDTSSLSGYSPTAELPDPLNSLYNVTPAYIDAMNKQSEDKYHLPWYATATPPPTPKL